MRTALALVVVLGLSVVASAQTAPLTPPMTLQVSIANPIYSGNTVCVYVGNWTDHHEWRSGPVFGPNGVFNVSIFAGNYQFLNGTRGASMMVGCHGLTPGIPCNWQIQTTNLNGPTWNETGFGNNPFNQGSVTVRGM